MSSIITSDKLNDESFYQTISDIMGTEQFKSAWSEILKNHYFSAFSPSDHDSRQPLLDLLAQIYLQSGKEAVTSYLVDNGKVSNIDDYFDYSGLYHKIENLCTSLAEDVFNDEEIGSTRANNFISSFMEVLISKAEEHLISKDDSNVFDYFSSTDTVDLDFIATEGEEFDALKSIMGTSECLSVSNIYPSIHFISLLKLANISPTEFLNNMKGVGYPLDQYESDIDEIITETWTLLRKVEALDDVYSEDIFSIINHPKLNHTVRTSKNLDFEQALEFQDIERLLDGVSSYSSPVVHFRVSLQDLLSGKLDDGFQVKHCHIGLQNYNDGSGAFTGNKAPIYIDRSKGHLCVDSDFGMSVVETHGSLADAATEITEYKPNEWIHVGFDKYLSRDIQPDGTFACVKQINGYYQLELMNNFNSLISDPVHAANLEEAAANYKSLATQFLASSKLDSKTVCLLENK